MKNRRAAVPPRSVRNILLRAEQFRFRLSPSSPLAPFGASLVLVKRATITLSDDLEEAVERYVEAHDARPPLTAVVQAALRQYLTDRGYLRSSGSLRITPARKGSGRRDVSKAHDRYLAAK
jgi:hypothetical protein